MSTRPTRWVRRHPIWSAVITLSVLLIAGTAWLGWRTWVMVDGLQKLSTIASTASADLSGANLDGLTATLTEAQAAATQASTEAHSLPLQIASYLPFIGDDIRALRTVSNAADALITAAQPLAGALPHLTKSGGGFNLDAISSINSTLDTLSAAISSSNKKLARIDTSGLIGPLAEKVTTLTDGLTSAEEPLTRLKPFLSSLPIILGNGGTRTWLIINQNLGEARVTGGLVSAYVVITVKDGSVTLDEQGNNDMLLATNDLINTSSVPRDLYSFWGEEYFNDWSSLNLAANFPDTGKLMTSAWNARGGTKVDGVITLGQGIVQYLAAATGDVKVGSKTIAPNKLADYLTVGVYKDFTNVKKKDAAVASIIGQVFANLADGHIHVGSLLKTALSTSTADALQIWSRHSADQKDIVAAGVDGSMPTTDGPITSVRFINGAGNKLDAFQQTSVSYTLGTCTIEPDTLATRAATFSVTVTNDAPTSGLPSYMTGRLDLGSGAKYTVGSTRKLVLIYAPMDVVNVTSVTVDGTETPVSYGTENGRQFLVVDLDFEPGQAHTIVANWDEPAQDDNGHTLSGHPRVILPPLINAATVNTPAAATCK